MGNSRVNWTNNDLFKTHWGFFETAKSPYCRVFTSNEEYTFDNVEVWGQEYTKALEEGNYKLLNKEAITHTIFGGL